MQVRTLYSGPQPLQGGGSGSALGLSLGTLGLVWSGLDLWLVCSQDFDFMRDSLHELPVEQVARMCGLCIDFARVGGLVVGFR